MSETLSLNSMYDSFKRFILETVIVQISSTIKYSSENSTVPVASGISVLILTYAILFAAGIGFTVVQVVSCYLAVLDNANRNVPDALKFRKDG